MVSLNGLSFSCMGVYELFNNAGMRLSLQAEEERGYSPYTSIVAQIIFGLTNRSILLFSLAVAKDIYFYTAEL